MSELYRKQFDEQCQIEARSFDKMIAYSSPGKIDPTSFSVAEDCHRKVQLLREMLIRVCKDTNQDKLGGADNDLLVKINEESNRMIEILNKFLPIEIIMDEAGSEDGGK